MDGTIATTTGKSYDLPVEWGCGETGLLTVVTSHPKEHLTHLIRHMNNTHYNDQCTASGGSSECTFVISPSEDVWSAIRDAVNWPLELDFTVPDYSSATPPDRAQQGHTSQSRSTRAPAPQAPTRTTESRVEKWAANGGVYPKHND